MSKGGRTRSRRLDRAARRLTLAALATISFVSAHAGAPDPSTLALFVGTWACTGVCKLTAICGAATPAASFTGTTLAIEVGDTSDLVLQLGCGCRLPLTVSSSGESCLLYTSDAADER